MSCSQVLYAAVERPLKDSRVPVGTPEEIAVTMDPLMESHRAKRADVLKDANDIPTGSSPMAQTARSRGATPFP